MRRIGIVALVVCLMIIILVFAQSAFAGTMYATDDTTGNLYIINTTTAAATLVGPTGQELSSTGLAYDSSNHTMYVSDVSIPEGYGLGSVNLSTGAVTIIGSHVISFNIHGLAFVPSNNTILSK